MFYSQKYCFKKFSDFFQTKFQKNIFERKTTTIRLAFANTQIKDTRDGNPQRNHLHSGLKNERTTSGSGRRLKVSDDGVITIGALLFILDIHDKRDKGAGHLPPSLPI